jgi:uncharacterized protein (TIGR00725 family)
MVTTIGVIGRGIHNDGDPIDPYTMEFAKRVGQLIAERQGVVVTGGLGGVMEAASEGAKAVSSMTGAILKCFIRPSMGLQKASNAAMRSACR